MSQELTLSQVLLLALLPAVGSITGVLAAELREPPRWLTGAALHMAAGVATAVAAIELIPRAEERTAHWLLAGAILLGALVSMLLVMLSRAVRGNGSAGHESLWGAHAAITIDLFSDGLMTGGGAAVAGNLGILLAGSQVLGNLPGGFAVTAGFRGRGVERRTRLLAALSYPIAPLAGALGGYLALNGASDALAGFVLALFAGLLLTATIEDLIPEADEPGAPRRFSSPSFAAGFVILLLMSAYVG